MTAPDPTPTPLADRLREALVKEYAADTKNTYGMVGEGALKVARSRAAYAEPFIARALDRAGLVLAERPATEEI